MPAVLLVTFRKQSKLKEGEKKSKAPVYYIIIIYLIKSKALVSSHWVFLVAQLVQNLPATQETWVQSLGQEDPLEEGMATHSSIPAWRIPWTEEPGGL